MSIEIESLARELDLDFILESLKYSRFKFEEYQRYPNQEYKQKRVQEATDAMHRVNALKKALATD